MRALTRFYTFLKYTKLGYYKYVIYFCYHYTKKWVFEVLTAVVFKNKAKPFSFCQFHAGFLLGLNLNPEDMGDMLLRNIDWLSTDYTVLYTSRQNSSIKNEFLIVPKYDFQCRVNLLPTNCFLQMGIFHNCLWFVLFLSLF
jgi:hypothetical protein